MKQGIIFGIIISLFSFIAIQYITPKSITNDLDIIIMQNGEEVYSTPLLYSEQTQIIWYVHEEDEEIKILVDEQIIEYYNFDLTLEQLQNADNINYDDIYQVSGVDTEINMIINTNGGVRVIEANCPDKIDVQIGEIRTTDKVITCAPHKLVIKLRSNNRHIEGEIDG